MGTKILVVNSGSSSIKYRLFGAGDFPVLASGMVEKIGESGSRLQHRWKNHSGKFEEILRSLPISNHRGGRQHISNVTSESKVLEGKSELLGIGHRVVHGGEVFHEPALIDGTVLSAIRELIPLASLHNPENLLAIEAALERYPHVPQVAVFDTAFQQSLPPYAFHYALPYDFYTAHHVRRYGFHGTSHHYVAKRAAMHLGKSLTELNLITLHLGSGASATAIKGGKSYGYLHGPDAPGRADHGNALRRLRSGHSLLSGPKDGKVERGSAMSMTCGKFCTGPRGEIPGPCWRWISSVIEAKNTSGPILPFWGEWTPWSLPGELAKMRPRSGNAAVKAWRVLASLWMTRRIRGLPGDSPSSRRMVVPSRFS